MSLTPCLRFVRRVKNAFMTNAGHDFICMPNLDIVAATPGRVVAKMRVEQRNVNRLGSVHGGLICSLTDTMGSLALASKGMYSTGVSTNIEQTFVKAAGKVGDDLIAIGEVVSMGKTIATTRIELQHPVTKAVLAFGSHTKFVAKAAEHPENVSFDESGEKVTKGKQPSEWAED